MIFITTYRVKPYLSQDETKELMGVFAEIGKAPGELQHYIAADGSHGIVISESDNPEDGYRNQLNYSQWIEFDTKVMLTIDQAVPHILEALV